MSLTQSDCESALANMKPAEEAHFLARLGHGLTVIGRGAYEFQAPGVKDPIALRQLNEIHHRIYTQIANLILRGERIFDPETLASWLTAEEKDAELRADCIWVFEKTLEHVSRDANPSVNTDRC